MNNSVILKDDSISNFDFFDFNELNYHIQSIDKESLSLTIESNSLINFHGFPIFEKIKYLVIDTPNLKCVCDLAKLDNLISVVILKDKLDHLNFISESKMTAFCLNQRHKFACSKELGYIKNRKLIELIFINDKETIEWDGIINIWKYNLSTARNKFIRIFLRNIIKKYWNLFLDAKKDNISRYCFLSQNDL